MSRRKVSAGGASSERIDLSAMQHMINAAEPVDMNALLAFYEDFTPCGLTPGVIVPTFGLAEHCVYVCSCEPRHFIDATSDNGHTTQLHNSGVRFITCSKADLEVGTVVVSAPSEDATDEILDRLERSLVSCGNPSTGDGVSVLIVDPVSLAKLEEGKVLILFASALQRIHVLYIFAELHPGGRDMDQLRVEGMRLLGTPGAVGGRVSRDAYRCWWSRRPRRRRYGSSF